MGYTDLTSTFTYKGLLTHQQMDALAENDAADHLDGGTVMCFFQATAPAGWVIQSIVNDSFIRIVDGAGGGSGGNTVLSTGMSDQNHNHTAPGHTHSIPAHFHLLQHNATVGSLNTTAAPAVVDASATNEGVRGSPLGSGQRIIQSKTATDGSGTTGSASLIPTAHTGYTDIAYVDIIVCIKGG